MNIEVADQPKHILPSGNKVGNPWARVDQWIAIQLLNTQTQGSTVLLRLHTFMFLLGRQQEQQKWMKYHFCTRKEVCLSPLKEPGYGSELAQKATMWQTQKPLPQLKTILLQTSRLISEEEVCELNMTQNSDSQWTNWIYFHISLCLTMCQFLVNHFEPSHTKIGCRNDAIVAFIEKIPSAASLQRR